MSTYVIIHGISRSDREPHDYVGHIVYGHPRIEAVQLGDHFVAICEFPEEQATAARYTFERMGSFPHGAEIIEDQEIALREFGVWVRHYAVGSGFFAPPAREEVAS